jgi:hypothetical protein
MTPTTAAARATVTATSKALCGFALVAALAIAGCGGGGAPSASKPASFGWLHPSAPPAGWSQARLPSGAASVAYPSGWHRIASDPGTVSAAQIGPHGLIVGYVNATPQQANETLANWATFRPTHNAHEGDRSVRVLAAAQGVRFRTGQGSCVVDRYATSRTHYREIACLVAGRHGQTVVVAAATEKAWAHLEPTLRRAVATFAT